MSGKITNNLNKERIHELLVSIGSKSGGIDSQEGVTVYNWNEPRCFNRVQLIKLRDFTKKIETVMAGKFSSFCRTKFDVTIASTTFHFASEFLKAAPEEECKDYFLPFDAGRESPCGFIGIPEQTAIVCARQLLGDTESGNESNVTLSQLEESLLLDLASALIEAFSALHAQVDFHPAECFLKNKWPLQVHETEELCRMSFDLQKDGSEVGTKAYLMIVCEELNSVVDKARQTAVTFSAEEISKAAFNHLQAVPVTITAQLVSTELTFEEVATLQIDDILLFDKKVNQPVDLIVNGRTVYYGWPVQSAGKYAVTIESKALEKVP